MVDSNKAMNLLNKFQKNGGSVQNNMENKEWLLKNIPGSILLYRVVFLKCHILGQNTVVLGYFFCPKPDFGTFCGSNM